MLGSQPSAQNKGRFHALGFLNFFFYVLLGISLCSWDSAWYWRHLTILGENMPHRTSTKYSYSKAQYSVEVSGDSSQDYRSTGWETLDVRVTSLILFQFLYLWTRDYKIYTCWYNMKDAGYIYIYIHTYICIYVSFWENIFVIWFSGRKLSKQ